MQTVIQYIQVVVSILLVASIMVQNRGAGMGAAFGGDSAVYRTKRGAEKFIYYGTIVLSVLFLGLTLALLFL